MSRRTKWLGRFGRPRSASSRRAAHRSGRALSFEQCEPRVVLSTNAGAGEFLLTTSAVFTEGGLIGFDSDVVLISGTNGVIPSIQNFSGSAADSDGASLFESNFHLLNSGTPRVAGFGVTTSSESSVRLIESPLAGWQQPEGGHIAIIDHPGVRTFNNLAGSQIEMAEAKVARQLPAPPGLNNGDGLRDTTQVDGLRGRAVVFEVAQATTEAIGDGHALNDPERRLVSHELRAAISSTPLATSETPAARSAIARPAASESSPHRMSTTEASPRGRDMEVDHFAASSSVAEPTHSEVARELATRDEALAQWGRDDAAPLAEMEPAPTPGDLRSRKVLALALVLTLGAGSVSKFFRRRAPNTAMEQRPPRRRPDLVEPV